MLKYLIALMLLILLTACSKNNIFPTDTKVYDTPENYSYNYEEFYFKSSQGALLKGWWFKSKEPAQGMVVVVNGLVQNMSNRFKEWTWLLEKGYDLFIFDYRGYGTSFGEVDMFGFVDDATAGISYAHELNTHLPMVVVGQSMGGSFVIDAVAKKPYPYVKLLVIDSTMKGFIPAGEALLKSHFLLWPLVWIPSVITPEGIDSLEFVDKTELPTLFMVGLDDALIPPEHSAALFTKAQLPKALWIVEGAGHVECIHNPKVKRDLEDVIAKALQEKKSFICETKYYEPVISKP